MKVLFLTKESDARADRAIRFLEKSGVCDVTTYKSNWGDPLPDGVDSWNGDLLISYLSRWIIPPRVLKRFSMCLNFHPAPPDYRGIGGSNWALYDGAKVFGVTCHQMAEKLDAGFIVSVRRFPVFVGDDAASLNDRAWDNLLALFHDVMWAYIDGRKIPECSEAWTGRLHTRAELNKLATVDLSMSGAEIRSRIRATQFKEFYPLLDLGDGIVVRLDHCRHNISSTDDYNNPK